MEAKYYTFSQNNSGGYFVKDEEKGVCEYLIIQATSVKNAIEKMESIGDSVSGFWNYCDCCGERWSTWIDESDGYEEPMIYGEIVYDEMHKEMFRSMAPVHYLDGTFKNFKFQD